MLLDTAVILAGGLGTRLRSVVSDVPKPMALVNGRPFLEILIDYWILKGIKKFIVSVCYKPEVIVNYFGDNYKGANIAYVIEKKPLGTGGALMLASESLKTDVPFLLLNGDTFFDIDLKNLLNFYLKNEADWCFSLFRTCEVSRYMSIEISKFGKIKSLNASASNSSSLANGGVYMVNPLSLKFNNYSKLTKQSLEDDIFPLVKGMGQKMFGFEFKGLFIDIGIPEDYKKAQLLF